MVDSADKRKNPRFKTMAHVCISGVTEDECLLKDISITGCCVECAAAAYIQLNTRYQLEIKPEGIAHIGSFQIETESKWVRNSSNATEVGLSIVASPKGKQFQHYVDYLAYRHLHP